MSEVSQQQFDGVDTRITSPCTGQTLPVRGRAVANRGFRK